MYQIKRILTEIILPGNCPVNLKLAELEPRGAPFSFHKQETATTKTPVAHAQQRPDHGVEKTLQSRTAELTVIKIHFVRSGDQKGGEGYG